MFFDDNGILNIDELVNNSDSFKKIMEDNIVTDDEIKEQSDKVIGLLRNIENKYTAEQIDEIKELLSESSVLYAIYNIHNIQNLNK